MIRTLFFLVAFTLLTNGLWAQPTTPGAPAATGLGETESTVRGIRLQIFQVNRIPGDRLTVIVKVYAEQDAAPNGTQLGTIPALSNGAQASDAKYQAKPFSLLPATLTDDATQTSYAAVRPLPGAPPILATSLTTLMPTDATYLSIQFPLPPPPQSTDGSVPHQTVSIQLNNGRGPITKVVIPPPTPAPAPGAAGTSNGSR